MMVGAPWGVRRCAIDRSDNSVYLNLYLYLYLYLYAMQLCRRRLENSCDFYLYLYPLGVGSCAGGRWDNSCDTSGYWFHQSTPGMARPQQQKFYNQQSQHQKKEENLSLEKIGKGKVFILHPRCSL